MPSSGPPWPGTEADPALLRELFVTLGGADRGEEDFPNWRVAEAVSRGRIPEYTALLERAVERIKSAHLEVAVIPGADMASDHWAVLTGGVLMEITGDDIQRSDCARYAALTGGVMVEVWEES